MQLRTWCGLSANLSFELREFPTELTNAVFIERAPLPWAVARSNNIDALSSARAISEQQGDALAYPGCSRWSSVMDGSASHSRQQYGSYANSVSVGI